MSVCLFLHTPAGQAEECAGQGPAVRTVFMKKGTQGRGQMVSLTEWDNAKGSQRGGQRELRAGARNRANKDALCTTNPHAMKSRLTTPRYTSFLSSRIYFLYYEGRPRA